MPKIAIALIVIPEDRQRKDLGDLSDLERSLEETGLIQPIVLRQGNILVAGERRLTSAKNLGWTEIDYHNLEDLSDDDAQVVELEENVKRLSMSWPDQCKTYLRLHEILEKKALAEKKSWSYTSTAKRLAMSTQLLSRHIALANELKTDPELANISTLSTAYNTLARRNERRFTDTMDDLSGFALETAFSLGPQSNELIDALTEVEISIDPAPATFAIEDIATGETKATVAKVAPIALPAAPVQTKPIALGPQIVPPENSLLNTDFIEWSRTYSGPKFNFIHCDFPYDAGAGRASSQINAGGDLGTYEDNGPIFWQLCEAMMDSMSNVIAPSAHIVFWHLSEKTFEVMNFFRSYEKTYDLRVFNIPLIWHKTDNTGVLSDPARRARHIYESAIVVSRGDRKIVKSVGDVYGCPISRSIHPAEKPQPMLEHFFRMFVSETTRMLDPTCGSGTSLRAAEALGASEVLGFELDGKFAEEARAELGRFRKKRLLAEQSSKKED